MVDRPPKSNPDDGCVLWLIFLALAPITGGLYAIASAIKGIGHG